jgi:hypothetical protein
MLSASTLPLHKKWKVESRSGNLTLTEAESRSGKQKRKAEAESRSGKQKRKAEAEA